MFELPPVRPSVRLPAAAATMFLLFTGAGPAAAQVGHDPATSPYTDVRHSVFIVASGGQFFGSGGDAGVAPHDGPVVGLRLSFLANKTVQIDGGIMYGFLGRLVYDPFLPVGQRFTGPVDNDVLWAEGAIHFNLMGGKTWHRLAPFVGNAIGLAFVEDLRGTAFNLGTKFYFAPLAGVRYFLSDALALTVEGRFQFWTIKYTVSFAQEGISASEWSTTPWVNIGLAVAWPF